MGDGRLGQVDPDRQVAERLATAWLATTLSSRSRTGSDSALSLTASSAAAWAVSGCRTKGAIAHPDASVSSKYDFDTCRYCMDVQWTSEQAMNTG